MLKIVEFAQEQGRCIFLPPTMCGMGMGMYAAFYMLGKVRGTIMKKSGPLTVDEREQIVLLTAEGRTPNYIGKALGRDRKTVVAALGKPATAELVEGKRADLADMYEDLTRRMMNSITDEDICKINAYQRMVASGIATDKARLLRGQSTVNLAAIYSKALEVRGDPDEGGE